MDFWSRFVKFIGDSIPKVLMGFLKENGYDTALALKLLKSDTVDYLENFGLENSEYSKYHKRLLPGHRETLLAIPSLVEEFQRKRVCNAPAIDFGDQINDPDFSFILQQIVKSAKENANKDANHRRFSQELQHFSMLLYMMCGKISYEIISNNMPLPQPSTTCKLNFLEKY